MRHVKLILICIALVLGSCSKTVIQTSGDVATGKGPDNLIGWNVSADDRLDAVGLRTRALVNDYISLRDACTRSEYQEAEKIGLLGKYTLNGVSKVVFDDVDLWWWEKDGGNPYYDYLGNNNCWNYAGENVYWTYDATYHFKAYFPKSKVELQPGSGADKILAVYDTQVSQYDLMVAQRTLDSQSENPINLFMQHALAALKFDFQFVDDHVSDNLLMCWMENHDENGFYTSCTLNYAEDIVWPHSTATPVGTPFYYWEPAAPVQITGKAPVDAYSASAAVGKGREFTGNDGWILIIPQSSAVEGGLKLCFRTSTGGNVVYSVDLPGYDYKPGYRYNYHIKISSTEIKVGLTVAQWNERKSSYEIDFND